MLLHLRRNWKRYALVGAALVAARYGVDLAVAQAFLRDVWSRVSGQ